MPWKKGNPGCPCCEDACRIAIGSSECDTYSWSWDGDWGGWIVPGSASLSSSVKRTGSHSVSMGADSVHKTFDLCNGGGTLTIWHLGGAGYIEVNGSFAGYYSTSASWTQRTISLSAGINKIELFGTSSGSPTYWDDVQITNVQTGEGGWIQVAETWNVAGSALETEDSDALAVTVREHPEGKSTHYVTAKLSGADDGDVLRLIVAYDDADNYLFGEIEVGTSSGVLRLFQMASGSLYQLGQDASVADLAAGTTYEVTVCYDGVRLTIMLVGKAGYSQPATATGTRVGVATGGIHAAAYFGSFKWYAHYEAGWYYEEPNECPECRLRGQCTVCENNQTPQFLQVSITGTWIGMGCLGGCLNLDGTYILPPVDQAYSHDPPDNGCDYELVLTGEDVSICNRADPTDPSASIYIRFRKAGSPLRIQMYGLIKIFSDNLVDAYEYLRDWGPADPFDPTHQLIPCLTLNNRTFQSSTPINQLLCFRPPYDGVKVTSLD